MKKLLNGENKEVTCRKRGDVEKQKKKEGKKERKKGGMEARKMKKKDSRRTGRGRKTDKEIQQDGHLDARFWHKNSF